MYFLTLEELFVSSNNRIVQYLAVRLYLKNQVAVQEEILSTLLCHLIKSSCHKVIHTLQNNFNFKWNSLLRSHEDKTDMAIISILTYVDGSVTFL